MGIMPGMQPPELLIVAFSALLTAFVPFTRAEGVSEIRLGYFPNLTHAQAVLGTSSGDFEKAVAPTKFSTKTFNAGPSAIEALFANEVDVTYIGPSPALNGFIKSKGDGVVVIAGSTANGVIIVARKNSGVTTLADLKGKRVATPQLGNTQDIAAKHYLKSVLKQDDVDNVLAVPNAEQSALFARGQLDASWAPEPWGSRLIAETGAKQIAAEGELWPEGKATITVIITSPKFLKANPDVIEKLLKVHIAWTKKLQKSPDEVLPQLDAALFALTNKKLPPGVGAAAFKNTTFTTDPLVYTFDRFSEWAFELGLSRTKPNLKKLVDTTILDKLQSVQ